MSEKPACRYWMRALLLVYLWWSLIEMGSLVAHWSLAPAIAMALVAYFALLAALVAILWPEVCRTRGLFERRELR
jgi:sugar phosphate permease